MAVSTKLLISVALTLVVGCSDSVAPPAFPGSTSASIAAARPDDDGIRMRNILRQQSDSALVRSVEDHNNVVIVGFKPESAPWGVNERGQSLVLPHAVTLRANAVRRMARRIIYEFRHIPAVAVQLPSSNVALQLRRLPWVDYVQPNTRDMTPDQAEGGDAACSPLQTTQQTVPWNVTRVRAHQAWGEATGLNGILLVLDDGIDISQGFPEASQEIVWTGAIGFSGQSVRLNWRTVHRAAERHMHMVRERIRRIGDIHLIRLDC